MVSVRVNYRRHNHHKTVSNKYKLVRTPGNRVVVQYTAKKGHGARAPAYLGHERLQGVRTYSSSDRHNVGKQHLTVSRPYGGVLTHKQLRERIVRAFLVEEQKIVKRVAKTAAKRK